MSIHLKSKEGPEGEKKMLLVNGGLITARLNIKAIVNTPPNASLVARPTRPSVIGNIKKRSKCSFLDAADSRILLIKNSA